MAVLRGDRVVDHGSALVNPETGFDSYNVAVNGIDRRWGRPNVCRPVAMVQTHGPSRTGMRSASSRMCVTMPTMRPLAPNSSMTLATMWSIKPNL